MGLLFWLRFLADLHALEKVRERDAVAVREPLANIEARLLPVLDPAKVVGAHAGLPLDVELGPLARHTQAPNSLSDSDAGLRSIHACFQ